MHFDYINNVKKTCPLCLHSGDPKYTASRPSRLLLGAFIFSFGLFLLSGVDFSTIFDDTTMVIIFFYMIILLIALYLILIYYSIVSKLCSKCTNEVMIDHNSPEAQELLKQNDLKEVFNEVPNISTQKICINCRYVGRETITQYLFVVWPIILILISIGSFFVLDDYRNPTIAMLAYLILLLFSIYTLIIFFDKKEQCPNCSESRTMIPLDTPKAQQLIKENNLSVPE